MTAATAVQRGGGAPARVAKLNILPRLVFIGAFLVTWMAVAWTIPVAEIPSPGRVLGLMFNELRGETIAPVTVYSSFATSLWRLLIGFSITFVGGVTIGVLMGLFRPVRYLLHDWVSVGLQFPYLVWALLMGMWLGLGGTGPIYVVVLAALPYVIMNTYEGVKNSPKELFDFARAYDVPRMRVIRHIMIPSLSTFLFAALRYGLANGWKAIVIGEVFAAANGAGWVIRYFYDAHRAHGLLGYAFFFIIFAIFVERGIWGPLEKYIFRWRPDPEAPEELAEEVVIPELAGGREGST